MVFVGFILAVAAAVFGLDLLWKNNFRIPTPMVFGSSLGISSARWLFVLGVITGAALALGIVLFFAGLGRKGAKAASTRRERRDARQAIEDREAMAAENERLRQQTEGERRQQETENERLRQETENQRLRQETESQRLRQDAENERLRHQVDQPSTVTEERVVTPAASEPVVAERRAAPLEGASAVEDTTAVDSVGQRENAADSGQGGGGWFHRRTTR